jgi:hypothetical protein
MKALSHFFFLTVCFHVFDRSRNFAGYEAARNP